MFMTDPSLVMVYNIASVLVGCYSTSEVCSSRCSVSPYVAGGGEHVQLLSSLGTILLSQAILHLFPTCSLDEIEATYVY
jgi:hypothetical protein